MNGDTKNNIASDGNKPATDKIIDNEGITPADPTPTSSGGLVWFVVLLGVIAVGGWALWPEIGPSIKPIIAKVRGISSPEDFVAQQTISSPGANETALVKTDDQAQPHTRIREETAPPETTTSAMPTTPDMASGEQEKIANALENIMRRLDVIEQRLGELEQRPQFTRDPTASAQALVLATTQLAARLGGEGPFRAELDVLEKVAGDVPEVMQAINDLKSHSEAGIPTVATLSARFADVGKEIMQARLRGSDGGWMGEIKDRLGSLVVVRRTNPATTTDPVERAVALATDALEVGALDEAVQAIRAIEGDISAVGAPWLGDADTRLMAERLLEVLNNHALARLGAAAN